jgi:hypothetical protein
MNIQLIPPALWLLGSGLLIAGTARFGAHTAAIVAGVLFLKAAAALHAYLNKGFSK